MQLRRIVPWVAMMLVVMGLDQASKYWLLYEVGMASRPPIVVTDFFSLVMVWNQGVSFGMFAGVRSGPYLLIALAGVIAVYLAWLASKSTRRWEQLAYGMVIGGALGNVLDRIRVGAVADFFYFHIGDLGWPAFNVADSAIFVGVCILLLTMLRNSKVAA